MRAYVLEVDKHYELEKFQDRHGVCHDFSQCLAHVRSHVKEANLFLVDIIAKGGVLVKPNLLYLDDGTPAHESDFVPGIKVKAPVPFLNQKNVAELIGKIRTLLDQLDALMKEKS